MPAMRSIFDPFEVITAQPAATHHFSQSDIITIEVGEDKTIFRAYRDLLCKAKFFQGCLEQTFSEAATNTVSLKEEGALPVSAFMEWIYTGSVTLATIDAMCAAGPMYRFADNICCEAYCNDLMDVVRKRFCHPNLVTSRQIMAMEKDGLGHTQFVRFLIDLAAWNMVRRPQSWLSEEVSDSIMPWTQQPETMQKLLKAISKYQSNLSADDPSKLYGCHYHEHKDGSKCSAAKAR